MIGLEVSDCHLEISVWQLDLSRRDPLSGTDVVVVGRVALWGAALSRLCGVTPLSGPDEGSSSSMGSISASQRMKSSAIINETSIISHSSSRSLLKKGEDYDKDMRIIQAVSAWVQLRDSYSVGGNRCSDSSNGVVMHTSIYSSIHLFNYLFIHFIHLQINLSIHPSIYLSLYPSIQLIHLSITLSIHPSIYL